MNYFPFHVGDYAAATAHLSWDEDMAYTRLLRAYYLTEQPIPLDKAYRLARAATPAQRKAVDSVLAEFFIKTDSGYEQTRCDAEIAKFQDKQDKAQRSANARWKAQSTHSEGNAKAMRTHSEGNANHNQEPITNNQKKNTKATFVATPDGVSDSLWADYKKLRTAKKSPITKTAIDGLTREAGKAGLPLATVLKICCERGWVGFKAEWMANKAAPESFKERDARIGRERWEEMTGEQHPDNAPRRVSNILNVIDVTPAKRIGAAA